VCGPLATCTHEECIKSLWFANEGKAHHGVNVLHTSAGLLPCVLLFVLVNFLY